MLVEKIKSLLNHNKQQGEIHPPFKKRYDICQIQRFEQILNSCDKSLTNYNSVLEFGCGNGRLIKHVINLLPEAKVFGSDVLKKCVDYCKRRLPGGNFISNDIKPPIDFIDNQFDLIYTYSVFTHLTEKNHLAWLQEFARILKPGGVMMHSVKSYQFIRRTELFSHINLSKYQLSKPIEELESKYPYYYVMDNPKMPEYGLTIISKKYIQTKWPNYTKMKILEYAEGFIEAYPEGCHDLVLLQKS